MINRYLNTMDFIIPYSMLYVTQIKGCIAKKCDNSAISQLLITKLPNYPCSNC